MPTREAREAIREKASRLVRSGFMGMGVQRAQRLPHLHHVTLAISKQEVGACLDFYTAVLGLKRVLSPTHKAAWFEQGIHLYWGVGVPNIDKNMPEPQHVALVVGERYNDIAERCKKLDMFLSHGTEYWGSPRCFVRDPCFNRLELIHFAP